MRKAVRPPPRSRISSKPAARALGDQLPERRFSRVRELGSRRALMLLVFMLAFVAPIPAHALDGDSVRPSRCPSLESVVNPSEHAPCGDLRPLNSQGLEICAQNILHCMAGDDLVAFFGFQPNIVIRDNPAPLAIAHAPRRVVVTTGITKIATTPDALAFVIAHELGHLELQHGRHRNLLGPAKATGSLIRERVLSLVDSELAADTYAFSLVREVGLDPAAGSTVLTQLRSMASEQGLLHEPLYLGIGGRISHLAALQRDSRGLGPHETSSAARR